MKVFRIFKMCIPAIFCFLASLGTANAGTVGMSGSWDFEGQFSWFDQLGMEWTSTPATGSFDFDSGQVSMNAYGIFFGMEWMVGDGTVSDNGNGTYDGDLETLWGLTLYNLPFLWEITDHGDRTASLISLDIDGNGIPGMDLTEEPIPLGGYSLEGTLTAVPVPAAAWLFISGFLGLLGFSRNRSN